jgi:hypothetical protein
MTRKQIVKDKRYQEIARLMGMLHATVLEHQSYDGDAHDYVIFNDRLKLIYSNQNPQEILGILVDVSIRDLKENKMVCNILATVSTYLVPGETKTMATERSLKARSAYNKVVGALKRTIDRIERDITRLRLEEMERPVEEWTI